MADINSTRINTTQAIRLPAGNNAQRPSGASVNLGMMRYNTEEEIVEVYDGTEWVPLGSAGGPEPFDFILEAQDRGRLPGNFTASDVFSNAAVAQNVGYSGYYKITIPSDGLYEITVRGTNGARDGLSNPTAENLAAEIVAIADLTSGTELMCLAGQQGSGVTSDSAGAGGGGGSFVAVGSTPQSATPLLIASGGGGSCQDRTGQENIRGYANTGEIGRAGVSSGYTPTGHGWPVGEGGQASNGDSGSRIAAWNGGGFFTDGSGTQVRSGGSHGQAFVNGAEGGLNEGGVGDGGFGGGGGGARNCGYGGGGGGYSGGGSGGFSNGCGGHGGGGGSFKDNSLNLISQRNLTNDFGYIRIRSLV